MPPITYESLLTVEDVCTAFKLQPRYVQDLAGRGELPALKIGRSWRFRRSSVEAWLAARDAAPAAAAHGDAS